VEHRSECAVPGPIGRQVDVDRERDVESRTGAAGLEPVVFGLEAQALVTHPVGFPRELPEEFGTDAVAGPRGAREPALVTRRDFRSLGDVPSCCAGGRSEVIDEPGGPHGARLAREVLKNVSFRGSIQPI
jgi:hypothetical protein